MLASHQSQRLRERRIGISIPLAVWTSRLCKDVGVRCDGCGLVVPDLTCVSGRCGFVTKTMVCGQSDDTSAD